MTSNLTSFFRNENLALGNECSLTQQKVWSLPHIWADVDMKIQTWDWRIRISYGLIEAETRKSWNVQGLEAKENPTLGYGWSKFLALAVVTINKLSACDPRVRDDTVLPWACGQPGRVTWHWEFPWALSGHTFFRTYSPGCIGISTGKTCLSQKLVALLKHIYYSRINARSPSIHTPITITSFLHVTERRSLWCCCYTRSWCHPVSEFPLL